MENYEGLIQCETFIVFWPLPLSSFLTVVSLYDRVIFQTIEIDDLAQNGVLFLDFYLYFCNMLFDLQEKELKMRKQVLQWTGIPVSVGIAPTKLEPSMDPNKAKTL